MGSFHFVVYFPFSPDVFHWPSAATLVALGDQEAVAIMTVMMAVDDMHAGEDGGLH